MYFQTKLLREDSSRFNLKDYIKGVNYFFGPRGKLLPAIPKLIDYFKPSFHPNQHDTEALLTQWRDQLFGIEGALKAQLLS